VIHKTEVGWYWDIDPKIRLRAPIPPQMLLTQEDVAEFMPKDRGWILEQNELWVRLYGTSLVFKKDGKWHTNYRKIK